MRWGHRRAPRARRRARGAPRCPPGGRGRSSHPPRPPAPRPATELLEVSPPTAAEGGQCLACPGTLRAGAPLTKPINPAPSEGRVHRPGGPLSGHPSLGAAARRSGDTGERLLEAVGDERGFLFGIGRGWGALGALVVHQLGPAVHRGEPRRGHQDRGCRCGASAGREPPGRPRRAAGASRRPRPAWVAAAAQWAGRLSRL